MKNLMLPRILVFALVLSTGLTVQSQSSFAQSRERSFHRDSRRSDHFRDFHHPRRPYFYHHLPRGYLPIRIADALFYYAEGTYYQETPSGYVVITAPRGAIVAALPERHKVIIYDNTDYYYYNSTYYVKQPQGYAVVTPPPSVVSSNSSAAEAPEKTVVVQVPNPNGSYIPVTLQKYSDGYTGPNGEFYPEYPTVDQLKAMYAKSSAVAEAPTADEELNYDIPNANGSFTRVKILKSKDGFVGPEGEFYPQKPTIEQLKTMYAKGK